MPVARERPPVACWGAGGVRWLGLVSLALGEPISCRSPQPVSSSIVSGISSHLPGEGIFDVIEDTAFDTVLPGRRPEDETSSDLFLTG